jgi:hypothetical protein
LGKGIVQVGGNPPTEAQESLEEAWSYMKLKVTYDDSTQIVEVLILPNQLTLNPQICGSSTS